MKWRRNVLLACALLAVGTAAVGLGSVNASAATETDWTKFEMDGASVRTADPTGIRFHTKASVSETDLENYTFGTLIIPETDLGSRNAEEYLTYENASVTDSDILNVPTDNWQETGVEYTSVLGGVNKTEYPKAKYNETIVARSYAAHKTNATDVKYTNVETRTLAQVASIALAATPDPEKPLSDTAKAYLNDVVEYVLGADGFALTAQTVADTTPVDITTLFSETNGSEGLTAKWSIVEGDSIEISYDDNGIAETFTAVKTGDTVLKAEIGEGSATVTVTVEDTTPAAIENVAYDSENGKITWTVDANAAEYNVTVEKWNDGSKSTYTVETNGYAIELTGGVYNVSVSGVSTFGTVGAAGTTEYASYVPASISGVSALFDFEDNNALDIVKPSAWSAWTSTKPISSTVTIVKNTDNLVSDSTAIKVSNDTKGFAGVAIRLPVAIPVSNVTGVRFDYYQEKTQADSASSDLNVVLSDGTNSVYKTVSASADVKKTVTLAASDFDTTAIEKITEIYFVRHNGTCNWYFDNISIITSYTEKATNEYVLADFTTTAYKPYLSVRNGTTYTIADGYMDIEHSKTFGDGDVRYQLPNALDCNEIQSITFYVKGKALTGANDATLQFRLYKDASTVIKSFHSGEATVEEITTGEYSGWAKVTYTLPTDFENQTLAYIGFAARIATATTDGYIWQVKEVTYTKKA